MFEPGPKTPATNARTRAARTRARAIAATSVPGERGSQDLFVVADDHMPVGIGRMRPMNRALWFAGVGVRRLNQVSATDLVIALWAQLCDHEIAALSVDEIAITVPHEECRGKGRRPAGNQIARAPHLLSGGQFPTLQLTLAHTVDVVALENRSADDRMRGEAVAPPQPGSGGGGG